MKMLIQTTLMNKCSLIKFLNYIYIIIINKHKQYKNMKFKVLEINNIVENSISYTESCIVENLTTKEVISINRNTASDSELVIINKVDDFDLEVKDIIYFQ